MKVLKYNLYYNNETFLYIYLINMLEINSMLEKTGSLRKGFKKKALDFNQFGNRLKKTIHQMRDICVWSELQISTSKPKKSTKSIKFSMEIHHRIRRNFEIVFIFSNVPQARAHTHKYFPRSLYEATIRRVNVFATNLTRVNKALWRVYTGHRPFQKQNIIRNNVIIKSRFIWRPAAEWFRPELNMSLRYIRALWPESENVFL